MCSTDMTVADFLTRLRMAFNKLGELSLVMGTLFLKPSISSA